MSAGPINKWHKIARAGLAVVAGGSYVGMQSAGYVDGTDTSVGVDAGTVRTSVTAILAMAVVWYPKLQNFRVFWSSLTNDHRVKELEATVADLKAQLDSKATPGQ